jgi:hypothetical protein
MAGSLELQSLIPLLTPNLPDYCIATAERRFSSPRARPARI